MNPNSHPKFINILFTSTSSFINSSDLFPRHDRRIGLTVTCGYHPESKQVMVLVEDEQPSFCSSQTGEYVIPDNAERLVRQKLSQLVETCRRQAKELMEHANRLEILYKQNLPLIDVFKVDKDEDHRVREEIVFHQQVYKAHAHNKPASLKAPIAKSLPLSLDDI